MNTDELAALDRVDATHWFYAGKRHVVDYWLARHRLVWGSVLDLGCGTGRFLAGFPRSGIGLDLHPLATKFSRRVCPRIVRARMSALPFQPASMAVVAALDVLEHLSDADEMRTLLEAVRVLRPDGLLVVHVPALPALMSDWDRDVGHVRRYTRATLLQRFDWFGRSLRILHCGYTGMVTLPAVWAVRTLQRWLPMRKRMEDRVPPRWLNSVLRWLFVAPACRWRQPIGSSLLLIARRI